MHLNSKIAKIPFFVLYLMLVLLVSYNWIRVILFQREFEIFLTEQPWDYFLSNFFIKNFGLTYHQYFLFTFPIILIILYIIPKVFGRLLDLDKKSNVKGDNYVALIIILLVAPVTLGIHKFLGSEWKNHLIPGMFLIIIFSVLSWLDEKSYKRK